MTKFYERIQAWPLILKISIGALATLLIVASIIGGVWWWQIPARAYASTYDTYQTAYRDYRSAYDEASDMHGECLLNDPTSLVEDTDPCQDLLKQWTGEAPQMQVSKLNNASRSEYEAARGVLEKQTGLLAGVEKTLRSAIASASKDLQAQAEAFREKVSADLKTFQDIAAEDRAAVTKDSWSEDVRGQVDTVLAALDKLDKALIAWENLDDSAYASELRDAYNAIFAAADEENTAYQNLLAIVPASDLASPGAPASDDLSIRGLFLSGRADVQRPTNTSNSASASGGSSNSSASTSTWSAPTTSGSHGSSNSSSTSPSTSPENSSYGGGSWVPSDTWTDVDPAGVNDDGEACFEEGADGQWRQIPCD